jgi:hypothetical protein
MLVIAFVGSCCPPIAVVFLFRIKVDLLLITTVITTSCLIGFIQGELEVGYRITIAGRDGKLYIVR